MSKANQLLEVIKQHSDKKGYVTGVDTELLAEETRLSKHDTNKYLYDLKKKGLIGFSSRKGGENGGLVLFRFRLRRGAMNGNGHTVIEEDETSEEIPIEVDEEVQVTGWPASDPALDATPPPTSEEVAATPPAPRYPALTALLDRKRLAEDAAKNLEALGADNLALQALAILDLPVTPLQKEILDFFASHPSFVKFVIDPELN